MDPSCEATRRLTLYKIHLGSSQTTCSGLSSNSKESVAQILASWASAKWDYLRVAIVWRHHSPKWTFRAIIKISTFVMARPTSKLSCGQVLSFSKWKMWHFMIRLAGCASQRMVMNFAVKDLLLFLTLQVIKRLVFGGIQSYFNGMR